MGEEFGGGRACRQALFLLFSISMVPEHKACCLDQEPWHAGARVEELEGLTLGLGNANVGVKW